MPDVIYESDPTPNADADYVAGELGLAVVGNRGRLLDARRTPLSLTAVDPGRGEIEVRIDAFEDRGARWRLAAWEITRLQLARESKRAAPAAVAELQRAVERFDRPLVVELDQVAAGGTWSRVAEQRSQLRRGLASVGVRIDLDACIANRRGEPQLYVELERYLEERDLLEFDRLFGERLVSNPRSGELVKGHAIVLAELGLCRFEGTVVRDPRLFEEPWSRQRRAEHLIARMAFAQELWIGCVGRPLTLYRAVAAEGALAPTRPGSLVSCTFSEAVADAHFAGGAATRQAAKWRQIVDPERLLITFLETPAFNARFREAEAVLIGDPSDPVF